MLFSSNYKEIVSSKEIENLLSVSGNYDSKHINNTTNQAIPEAIVTEIENEGISTERIQELISKGFDIYRYRTQITLHGKAVNFNADNYKGYKSLIQNKNGSIGIKWIAVDRDKRKRIINTLCYFGFSYMNSSSELFPMMLKRFDSRNEAIEFAANLKKDSARIDKTKFYGNVDLFVSHIDFLGYYVVYRIMINGIPEANVNTLLEQITGKSTQEIQNCIEAKNREIEEKRIAREKEYEIEKAKREAEAKVYNDQFMKDLEKDYIQVNSNELKPGAIFVVTSESYDYQLRKNYYTVTERTVKRCDEDGTFAHKEVGAVKYLTEARKVWIKKEVAEAMKQTVKEDVPVTKNQAAKIASKAIQDNVLTLINYSEKAIAIVGNTKPFAAKLKQLGGRFNSHLSCGAGWIFSKKHEANIRASLNLA